MPPSGVTRLEARQKEKKHAAFAAEAFELLRPLLQQCPGHWFRNPTAVNLDLNYLTRCFNAYLSFLQMAHLSGIREEDFSHAYHELRERDERFCDPSKAPWTNPFAAALALKEWVDMTTLYLKMMRDCVDIPVKRPWGENRDLWSEQEVDMRKAMVEWFETYNSKMPGKGDGSWKPAMRSALADEQARAWGRPETKEMEVLLGLRKTVRQEKEADEKAREVLNKTPTPAEKVLPKKPPKHWAPSPTTPAIPETLMEYDDFPIPTRPSSALWLRTPPSGNLEKEPRPASSLALRTIATPSKPAKDQEKQCVQDATTTTAQEEIKKSENGKMTPPQEAKKQDIPKDDADAKVTPPGIKRQNSLSLQKVFKRFSSGST